MPLSSASTLTDIQAAYDDNASYDLNSSVSQAQLFIQACRLLLRRMPLAANKDRAGNQFNPAAISQQLKDAQSWLAAASDGGGSVHFDLSNSRDEFRTGRSGGACP